LQKILLRKDIILTYVRWYLAYPLSDRDWEAMMAERDVPVDHANSYHCCANQA
jgi:transposase-like protein